jgi:hypothetical protein
LARSSWVTFDRYKSHRAAEPCALRRQQLADGPKPGAQIEATAKEAEISKPVLLAATDLLGVPHAARGQWWLPE